MQSVSTESHVDTIHGKTVALLENKWRLMRENCETLRAWCPDEREE